MGRAVERLLIVGIGGSGRTHHLRAWADAQQRQITGQIVWVRGAADHRNRANAARRLLDTLSRVDDDDALAVDDAHWLDRDVAERIIELTDRVPTAVARAPWPDSAALRELDATLAVHDPAHRLGPLEDRELSDLLSHLDDDRERSALLSSTAGLAGLVTLLVDAGVETTDTTDVVLPPHAVDAIIRRARASGNDVLDAARIMIHGIDVSRASELAASDVGARTDVTGEHDDLERRLRASGLLSEERLVPVVAVAVAADMTEADRRRSIALASSARDALEPDARSRLLLVSDADLLERARAAIHLGDPTADSLIATIGDIRDPMAARLAFVLDMRAMRWERASDRATDATSGHDVYTLADVLGGSSAPIDPTDVGAATVIAQVLDDLHRLIASFARGSTGTASKLATRLVDDAMRARVDLEAGWTPAAIAASLLMQIGRHESARTVLRSAIADGQGGPGEQASHHLLAAFGDIAVGEYSAALDLVRAGPADGWPHRDHFLLAALDAAIARRSGDTGRLRDAWRRSAPLVERQSLTWLLLDPTIEILAAGRRVGHDLAVGTALDRLDEQLGGWPLDGPGPAMLAWARLQVAIAGEDWEGVRVAAQHLDDATATDERSAARRSAAAIWASIALRLQTGTELPDESPVDPDAAISALVEVGDAWEASRLLGQLALDHTDPSAARSLLERARLLVSDPVEAADGLIAAGLSEREAEVARLVAEGRAYKEIGGQLFISAKTVEHHVARIKQRLGAGSRAELLSLIRELSGDP